MRVFVYESGLTSHIENDESSVRGVESQAGRRLEMDEAKSKRRACRSVARSQCVKIYDVNDFASSCCGPIPTMSRLAKDDHQAACSSERVCSISSHEAKHAAYPEGGTA
jgi:hypothetical protein